MTALSAANSTTASGPGAIAIGSNTTKGAQSASSDSIAIGGQSSVVTGATSGIALGRGATVNGAFGIAQGDGVTSGATGRNVAIGSSGTTSNSSSSNGAAVAIGRAQQATGDGAVAIGNANTAIGLAAIALGSNALANKDNTVAIGSGAQATGAQSISIGTGNVVSGDKSGAIGDPTTVTGSGIYTLGNNNGTVGANESGIFGNNNTLPAGSDNSRIVGNGNTVNSANVMVMGNGVTVGTGLSGAVVLGNASTVSAAADTPSTAINGTTYTFAGGAPADGDVVSVGSATAPRQIQNVAAGRISGTSTDAINGSQLSATNQAVTALDGRADTLGASTATNLGGGSAYDPVTGAVSAPSYAVNGTTYNNVGSALAASTTHYYSVNDGGTQGGNYNNNGATGTGALAAGVNASASGAGGVAIGAGAKASGATNTVAIGTGAEALGNRVIAIGNLAGTGSTAGFDNLAIGVQSGQSNSSSVNAAIGYRVGNNVSSTGNVALGNLDTGSDVSNASTRTAVFGGVTGNNVAVGGVAGQNVKGALNVGVGWKAGRKVDGYNNVGMGALAGYDTTGNNNIGIGSFASSTVVGDRNVGVGNNAGSNVTGAANVAAGDNAGINVSGSNNSALGTFAGGSVTGGNNVAVGFAAGGNVSGWGNIATGNGAGFFVTGDDNIASGRAAGGAVTGNRNISSGVRAGSQVSGTDNVASGSDAGAGLQGDGNIAVGRNAGSGYDPVTGTTTTRIVSHSISLGNDAQASADSAIAIGDGARASGDRSISIGTGNIVSGNNSGAIGDPTTITGSGSYSLGNNNTINANNAFVVGNNVTVGTGLDGAVVLGNASTANAAVPTASGTVGGITYGTYAGNNPAAGSIVSVGAMGAERQIKNVAAGQVGAASTDAINGSQLYATQTTIGNLAQSAASNLGGGVVVNADGSLSAPAYTVGGSTYNSVGSALSAAGSGWNLSAQGANATNVAPGASVDLRNADGNLIVGKTTGGNTVTFDLAKNIAVDSVTAGNSVLTTNGLTVNNGTNNTVYGATGMSITGGPSVTTAGIDAGSKVITNVATGTNTTDAVNVGQMDAAVSGATSAGLNFTGNDNAAGDVHRNLGQTLAIKGGASTAGTYSGANVKTVTDPTTGAINVQIADAPKFGSVTVNDGGTGKITGVTAGALSTGSTEAINGSQLYQTNQTVSSLGGSTASGLGGGATYDPTTGTVGAPSYLVNGNTYNNVGSALAASTTHYYSVKDGGTQGGNYNNEGATGVNALAAGVGATAVGQSSVAVGANAVANNFGDVSIGMGAGFAMGGQYNLAIGSQAGQGAVGTLNTAVGNGALIGANGSVNVGLGTGSAYQIVGDGNTALGAASGRLVQGNNNVALGTAAGIGIVANDTVSIGSGSVAGAQSGDVALGSGSVTSAVVATPSGTINGTTYSYAGINPGSTVSVGAEGAERTITNVAAGRVGDTSTDAINGSQLYRTNQAIESVAAVANSGWNLSAQGANATNVVPGASVDLRNTDGNLVVGKTGANNDVTFDLAKNIAVDSVTAGNSVLSTNGLTVNNGTNSSTYSATGMSIAGGPSVSISGVNAGSKVITNVSNGTHAGDAVNLSQLQAAQAAATTHYFSVNDGGVVGLGNYNNDGAMGLNALAAGVGASASGDGSVAIGQGAAAASMLSTAIGYGSGVGATGTSGVYIGSNAGQRSTGDFNSFIGTSSGYQSNGNGNTAFGGVAGSSVTGNANAAFGYASGEFVTGDANVAMGVTAGWLVTGNNNLATGTGAGMAVIGNDNTASGSSAGIGLNGDGNVAIGRSAGTGYTLDPDSGSMIDRDGNSVSAAPAISLSDVVAIGNRAITDADRSIALGKDALAGAAGKTDAIAIGTGARATGLQSISIGTGNVVSGDHSGAIGDPTTITGSGSYSLGNNNTIDANDVFVVGSNVTVGAGLNGAVVLGSGSTADAAVATSSGTVGGITYDNYAGNNPAAGSIVSVGAVGAERQIKNVAAGQVSAMSTDAINGSQLYATQIVIGNLAQSTAKNLGGGVAAGADGSLTAPSYTITGSGGATNTYNNVGDALTALNQTASAGWNLSAQGANATNVAPGASVDLRNTDGNLVVGKNTSDNTVTFDLAKNIAVDSVTTGNSVLGTSGLSVNDGTNSTSYGSTGMSITGGPSVTTAGIDAGNKVITNVAMGNDATDAVNVGQMNTAVSGATSAGLNFTGNDNAAGDVHRDLGQTLAIRGGASTAGSYSGANVKTVTDPTTGAINVQIAEAPVFTSVTTGNSVLGTSGLSVNDGTNSASYGSTGMSITGGPSVTTAGIDAGSKVITNVATGTNVTDAVNVGQMDAAVSGATSEGLNFTGNDNTAGDVHRSLGQTLAIKGGASTAGTYSGANVKTVTDPTTGAINVQIADAPKFGSVTLNDGGTGKITGLTAGALSAGSTEAINGSQLYQTNQTVGNLGGSTASNLGGGSSYDATTGTVSAPSYNITGTGGASGTYNNVGDALSALNQTASAGWNLSAQGTNATNVAPGASVDLRNGDGNIVVGKTGANNDVTFDLAKNIAVDSVTAGNSVLGTSGLSVNDGTSSTVYGATGMSIAGGPSVTTSGINAADSAITNVAPGINGTDAANVDQVNAAVSSTTTAGLNFTGNDATAGDVHRNLGQTLAIRGDASTAGSYSGANVKTVTDPTTGAIKIQIAEAPKFGTVTINDGGTGRITGVTAGTNGTDAANMSQLNAVSATANAGWNVGANGEATGGNVASGGKVDLSNSDGNVTITRTGTNLDFKLADDVKVNNRVTVGQSVLNTTGLTVDNGTTATAVAAGGVTSGNVNLSGVTNDIKGLSNTTLTDPSFATAGRAATEEQLKLVDTTASKGWNLSANGEATPQNIAPGGTANFANGDNVVITRNGNTLTVGTAKDVRFDSVTTGDTVMNSAGVTVGPNVTLGSTGLTIAGGPSVTTSGIDAGSKVITNVAAGTNSTDAANMGQLNAVSITASAGWNLSAQGANTTNVAPGASVDLRNTDGNLVVGKTGANNDVTFDLAKNIAVDTVTAGNSVLTTNGLTVNNGTNNTVYGATGMSIAGGPSVTTAGIDAGSKVITNVATGTNATDAVNVGQMDAAVSGATSAGLNFTGNDNAAGDVHRNLGQTLAIKGGASTAGTYSGANVKTVTDPTTGAINVQIAEAPKFGNVSINDGGTGKITGVTAGTNGTDAANMSQLNAVSATANAGWNLSGQGANATRVAPGASVDLSNTDGNIVVGKTAGDNDVTFDLAKNIAVDTVTAGNSVLGTNGLTVNNGTNSTVYGATGMSIIGGPSVTISGINAGGLAITNVGKGINETDAVNMSQLNTTNQNVAGLNGRVTQVESSVTTMQGDITSIRGDVSALDGRVTNVENTVNTINNGGGIRYFRHNVGDASMPDATADGKASVAVGSGARTTAAATQGVAMGINAEVAAANGTALGSNTSVRVEGGVALGEGSVASTAARIKGYVPGSASTEQARAIEATTSTMGAVSVGDAANGQFRQITGVAAGTQASDAVNVAQLQGVAAAASNRWSTGNTAHYVAPQASGSESLATGSGASASGANSMASGNEAIASGANAIAVGNGAVSS
ncbi:MAG TPA: hypothetical protein VN280_23295, partial [Variovorax sp.]|nr:hypothetical protein [Variovorax sp.]